MKYIWNTIGNGKRHLNEVEITAIRAANVEANKPADKPKMDKPADKAEKKPRNRKPKAEPLKLKQAA